MLTIGPTLVYGAFALAFITIILVSVYTLTGIKLILWIALGSGFISGFIIGLLVPIKGIDRGIVTAFIIGILEDVCIVGGGMWQRYISGKLLQRLPKGTYPSWLSFLDGNKR
jgi:hypothetical protein